MSQLTEEAAGLTNHWAILVEIDVTQKPDYKFRRRLISESTDTKHFIGQMGD